MYYYVNKIKTMLQAGIGEDRVRYYMVGIPENIPEDVAMNGFVIINPLSSTTEVADSQRDSLEGEIEIYVGVQARQDFNETDYDQDALLRALDILEGTDDAGVLKTDTVKYILRQKINNTWLSQTDFVVDYANQRDEGYIYAIKLTFTIYDQRSRQNS